MSPTDPEPRGSRRLFVAVIVLAAVSALAVAALLINIFERRHDRRGGQGRGAKPLDGNGRQTNQKIEVCEIVIWRIAARKIAERWAFLERPHPPGG